MGMEILKGSAEFLMGISQHSQLLQWLGENENNIGVAFTGRSNVGKSSLINSLFGKSTARISKTPGRTREVNIFQFFLSNDGKKDTTLPPLYLFDLPGYGHAEISKEMSNNWDLLMKSFFDHITRQVKIINIQDARHPDQSVDKQFFDFLKRYRLDTTLVFNKMDKIKTQKDKSALKKIKPQLFDNYKNVKYIHFVSADSKEGIKELHDSVLGGLLTAANIHLTADLS